MKILVIGYAQHGKDTLCEILEELYGTKHMSSSQAALELFLFDKLKEVYKYQTKEECFQDRVNHRSERKYLIKEYALDNGLDCYADYILNKQNCDIYCGARDRDEFEAARHHFDLVIWVDALGRGLPEEDYSSNELTPEDADIIVTNNGTKEDFKLKVEKLGKILFKV